MFSHSSLRKTGHSILAHFTQFLVPRPTSCTSEMSTDLDLDFFGQDLGVFAGFGSDLDLRSWQVHDLDLDLDLQIFFDNFANMLENVEMTHRPNSSFECYAVTIHFFRL